VEVDEAVSEAIREGARAGIFWKALRLSGTTGSVWRPIAQRHHRRATALLNDAMKRLGVSPPGR
jgi:hypothetical protein